MPLAGLLLVCAVGWRCVRVPAGLAEVAAEARVGDAIVLFCPFLYDCFHLGRGERWSGSGQLC